MDTCLSDGLPVSDWLQREDRCYEASIAGAAAESMMQSLKSLDLEAFNDCTDNLVSRDRSWLGFTTAEEYRVFNRISQTDLVKRKTV